MNKPNVSDLNHELLLSVQGQISTLTTTLRESVDRQTTENARIHGRIDEAQDKFAKSVDALKDALNARGRVSGGFILSLLAVVLSSLALMGGFGSSYISMKTKSLEDMATASREDRAGIHDRLHVMDREAAREQGRREEWERAIRRELDKAAK